MPGGSASGTWARAASSIARCRFLVWSSALPGRTPYCVASRPSADVSGAARAASGDTASAPATPAAEAPMRWRRLTSMTVFPRGRVDRFNYRTNAAEHGEHGGGTRRLLGVGLMSADNYRRI